MRTHITSRMNAPISCGLQKGPVLEIRLVRNSYNSHRSYVAAGLKEVDGALEFSPHATRTAKGNVCPCVWKPKEGRYWQLLSKKDIVSRPVSQTPQSKVDLSILECAKWRDHLLLQATTNATRREIQVCKQGEPEFPRATRRKDGHGRREGKQRRAGSSFRRQVSRSLCH